MLQGGFAAIETTLWCHLRWQVQYNCWLRKNRAYLLLITTTAETLLPAAEYTESILQAYVPNSENVPIQQHNFKYDEMYSKCTYFMENFGPNWDENGQWRKFHNEELYSLYHIPT